MEDIEIAKKVKLKKINEIAYDLDVREDEIECYGRYKAKLPLNVYRKK